MHMADVPGGLVGGPSANQDHFRWPRAHSRGLFLAGKLDSGKRESVSWQHSMKIDE